MGKKKALVTLDTPVNCPNCHRSFKSLRGRANHLRACDPLKKTPFRPRVRAPIEHERDAPVAEVADGPGAGIGTGIPPNHPSEGPGDASESSSYDEDDEFRALGRTLKLYGLRPLRHQLVASFLIRRPFLTPPHVEKDECDE